MKMVILKMFQRDLLSFPEQSPPSLLISESTVNLDPCLVSLPWKLPGPPYLLGSLCVQSERPRVKVLFLTLLHQVGIQEKHLFYSFIARCQKLTGIVGKLMPLIVQCKVNQPVYSRSWPSNFRKLKLCFHRSGFPTGHCLLAIIQEHLCFHNKVYIIIQELHYKK